MLYRGFYLHKEYRSTVYLKITGTLVHCGRYFGLFCGYWHMEPLPERRTYTHSRNVMSISEGITVSCKLILLTITFSRGMYTCGTCRAYNRSCTTTMPVCNNYKIAYSSCAKLVGVVWCLHQTYTCLIRRILHVAVVCKQRCRVEYDFPIC